MYETISKQEEGGLNSTSACKFSLVNILSAIFSLEKYILVQRPEINPSFGVVVVSCPEIAAGGICRRQLAGQEGNLYSPPGSCSLMSPILAL